MPREYRRIIGDRGNRRRANQYLLAHHRQASHLSRVVQDQRHPNDPVEKHEATRVDPQPIEDRTEQYGEEESAETAGETDDTGNNAHIVRKIVANVLEG